MNALIAENSFLQEEIRKDLIDIAKRTNKSLNFHVTKALIDYIEDINDVLLAEKRLEEIEQGNSKLFTFKKVLKILKLTFKGAFSC